MAKKTKRDDEKFCEKEVESSSIDEKISEEDLFYQDDESEAPPPDVFAYNELRSCADLYRMYDDKTLDIKPGFQREMVWKNTDQTKFIDSLSKELPIPSMCLSLDSKTQKWQVIDGLQRMSTIIRFLEDGKWELSESRDVDEKISGKTPERIRKEYPNIYKKIQNIALPITVLRCDYSKRSHREYIFTIFHRLNTGGIKLTNQEIRNAIFQGPFNDFLKECNLFNDWKMVFGDNDPKNIDRYRKIELILRFFAFYEREASYNGKLSSFLNDYMDDKRFAQSGEIESLEKIFQGTVSLIFNKITRGTHIEKMSNIAIDALLYGVAKNISYLADAKSDKVVEYYDNFKKSAIFSKELSLEAILKKEKVKERLRIAEKVFRGQQ